MDIRYERPMTGHVLQSMRYESGIDTSPGTLVKVTAGKLAAVAANDVTAIGYAMTTKDVSATADDYVAVMPFVTGHIYSVPAIATTVPGNPLEIAGADSIIKAADEVNPFARVVPDGGETGRTFFVIIASGLID